MANSNQNIETPDSFIKAVEEYFCIKFKYDMAANSDNAKCSRYYTERQNALSIDWPLDGWCWLNPPFRHLTRFIRKCKEQKDWDVKIISIWPLSSDRNQIPAWRESSVYVIHGRLWPEVRGLMLCQWWLRRPRENVKGLMWDREAGTLKRIWG